MVFALTKRARSSTWPCVSSPAIARFNQWCGGREMAFEDGFILLARQAGIAFLDGAQQALLGSEKEAFAVDVNGAAFKHQAASVP